MLRTHPSQRDTHSNSNTNSFKELAINKPAIIFLKSRCNQLQAVHTSKLTHNNGYLGIQMVDSPHSIRHILNNLLRKMVGHRILHSVLHLLYVLASCLRDKIGAAAIIISAQWLQSKNRDVCPRTRNLSIMVTQVLAKVSIYHPRQYRHTHPSHQARRYIRVDPPKTHSSPPGPTRRQLVKVKQRGVVLRTLKGNYRIEL